MKLKSFQETTKIDRDINDLAYLIGILRDGCFTRNKSNYIYRIRVYQKNKDLIDKIAKKFKNLFGKQPIIESDKRNGVWCLKLNSKRIYNKLVTISDYPGNQQGWKIPNWILKSTLDIKKNYVKGFFDAEGGVPHVEERDVKKKDIRIHFSQGNKEVLNDIKEMINLFGIKGGKICGPYFKKGYKNPMYAFIIHGVNEVTKFYHTFGSLHPLKIIRLKLIEDIK